MYHLVDYLYLLDLEFVAQSEGNNHARKHVKLFKKTYAFIFYVYDFFTKVVATLTLGS